MKKIDIVLLICIILMIIIGIGYLFLDILFSFGIISPTTDIRTELLIIEYALLIVLLGLILLKMLIKKRKKQGIINDFLNKTEFNQKITILEFKKMLELNYEIVFEYENEEYAIVQNGNFIELHYNCTYENGVTRSLYYLKFSSPNDFMENVKIHDKNIEQIINDIKIIDC